MFFQYVGRRFSMFLLIVFVAVSVNFMIPRLIPGDPIEQKLALLSASGGGDMNIDSLVEVYQKKFGLDQPLWKQYINYWKDLLRFDLGYSLSNYPQTVKQIISAGLPWTIGLVGTATVISFVLGSLLGAVLAWPKTPSYIRGLSIPLMVISAIPYFLLGIILIYFFAIKLHVFPAGGGYNFGLILRNNWESITDVLHHAFLPAVSVVVAGIGRWALGMRGSMVGTLGEDFIMLAEAKGLRPNRIFFTYGMRNSMLPQLTQLALSIGYVAAGTILVEVIFSYPGIGYQLYEAIQAKDYFVIQGIVLILILAIASFTFILDLFYPLIDPRITRRK